MSETDTLTAPEKTRHKLHTTTMVLYVTQLLGLVLSTPLQSGIATLGGVLMMGAIIMVYVRRGAAKGSYLETHYRWMVRTFWICGTVMLMGLIFWSMSIVAQTFTVEFMNTLPPRPTNAELQQALMELGLSRSKEFVYYQMPGGLWWIWRCAKGIYRLTKQQPAFKDALAEAT